MGKSWDSLRKRLRSLRNTYGAVAEFGRRSGFSRTAVDNWIDGKATPNLEDLDAIASGLDMDPAQAIHAMESVAQPSPQEISDRAILDRMAKALACLREKEAAPDFVRLFGAAEKKKTNR